MSRGRPFLFVAHAFPPVGGSGANRALGFTRYAGRYGWRPIVLTPGAAWASPRDDDLLREVPTDVTVVRTRSWEPIPSPPSVLQTAIRRPVTGQASLGRRLKGQLGHAARFPDRHWGWTPFAVAAGLRAIRQERVELIYSTAGPFTSHVVGLILHRLSRLPWVAELRDGWYQWNRAIFPDYPSWRGRLERSLEGAVVRQSSRVVLLTDLMAEAFRRQYPRLPASHFGVIPNGFDPAQYADLPPVSAVPARFRIVHGGALYYGRSAGAFLEAVGRLAATDTDFAERFELLLLGTLDAAARLEVEGRLSSLSLGQRVVVGGYQGHRGTLAALRSADLLLLVVNTTPGAEAAVPGKVFEYLAVGRPILAIAPPGAEAATIVGRARAGWVAPAHEVDAICAALREAYTAHTAGDRYAPDQLVIARYDRRALAGTLAQTFNDVLQAAPRLR